MPSRPKVDTEPDDAFAAVLGDIDSSPLMQLAAQVPVAESDPGAPCPDAVEPDAMEPDAMEPDAGVANFADADLESPGLVDSDLPEAAPSPESEPASLILEADESAADRDHDPVAQALAAALSGERPLQEADGGDFVSNEEFDELLAEIDAEMEAERGNDVDMMRSIRDRITEVETARMQAVAEAELEAAQVIEDKAEEETGPPCATDDPGAADGPEVEGEALAEPMASSEEEAQDIVGPEAAETLGRTLEALAEDAEADAVLDISTATRVDAQGLAVLLAGAERLQAQGRGLLVTGVPDGLRALLEASKAPERYGLLLD